MMRRPGSPHSRMARAAAITPLAAALLIVACGPRSQDTYRGPSSLSSKYRGGAVDIYTTPNELCQSVPYTPYVAPPPPTHSDPYAHSDLLQAQLYAAEDATLNEEGQVTSLVSFGAPAGEVMSTLAEHAELALLAQGHGAHVPLFVSINEPEAPLTARETINQIALSVGMRIIERDGVLLAIDAQRAVELQRQVTATREPLEPLATQQIKVRDPHATARLLARILLTCRERALVPSTSSSSLLLTATPTQHKRAEALIKALDATHRTPQSWSATPSRRELHGIPDSRAPICTQSGMLLIEPDLTRVLGAMIITHAEDRDEPLILGCGAMTPTYLSSSESVTIATLIKRAGLMSITPTTFASPEIATAALLDPEQRLIDEQIAIISLKHAHAAVSLIEAQFPSLQATAWDTQLILRGPETEVRSALLFIQAWDAHP